MRIIICTILLLLFTLPAFPQKQKPTLSPPSPEGN